jgi:hydroxyacylglutathione hydrolase
VDPVHQHQHCQSSGGHAVNPFLRSRQSTVIQAVKAFAPQTANQDVEIFANLRSWKNDFK